MTTDTLIIDKHTDIDKVMRIIDGKATEALNNDKKLFVQYTTDSKLTSTQNKAMHVWFKQCADMLNDCNKHYTYMHPIRNVEVEVDWDGDLFKRHIYKPTLANIKGLQSTQQQTTVDPSLVADAIARAFSIHQGINFPPWPDKHNQGNYDEFNY